MSTPLRKACSCGPLADATEDGGDAQADGLGEGDEGCGDLRRELARRGEDQAARLAGVTASGRCAAQAGDERQSERDGLAAAGAAAAEHVATREGVGKRVALDGEGLGLARGFEDGCELRGYAELKESRHGCAFG